MDLGCCFGQELRQLVVDGVPSEQLYRIDVDARFLDMGYDLFCDRETLRSKLIATDVLAQREQTDASVTQDKALEGIKGNVDVIWAGSFFHLFPANLHKEYPPTGNQPESRNHVNAPPVHYRSLP